MHMHRSVVYDANGYALEIICFLDGTNSGEVIVNDQSLEDDAIYSLTMIDGKAMDRSNGRMFEIEITVNDVNYMKIWTFQLIEMSSTLTHQLFNDPKLVLKPTNVADGYVEKLGEIE